MGLREVDGHRSRRPGPRGLGDLARGPGPASVFPPFLPTPNRPAQGPPAAQGLVEERGVFTGLQARLGMTGCGSRQGPQTLGLEQHGKPSWRRRHLR